MKCSHGMTTGQLDENALFYMQSRGIPRDEARMLLSVAFTSDVIDYVRPVSYTHLPEIKEEITANVEVLQVFKITKVGTIAGCMVREGKIKRSNKVRVIRDGIVVHAGELESLKRFKDDVKEVVAGLDCGLNLVNYNDIQVGDIIEAYEETEIKKTL